MCQDDLLKKYDMPCIQVSPQFVKDILARFSSYYARQGQPEIESNEMIKEIVTSFQSKKK